MREGRRNEFAEFAEFADEATRERIPDPNAVSTFENSRPDFSARQEPGHAEWYALYRELLSIRQREIVPRLQGAHFLESVCWRKRRCSPAGSSAMAAGCVWSSTLAQAAPLPTASISGELLFASREATHAHDQLAPRMARLYLEKATW